MLKFLKFRYTENRATLFDIPTFAGTVHVVGDPDNAAYEWVIRRNDGSIEHSDDAYGAPEIALRDGLVEALNDNRPRAPIPTTLSIPARNSAASHAMKAAHEAVQKASKSAKNE